MADIQNAKLDFLDTLRYYEHGLDGTLRRFLYKYQGNWSSDEIMAEINFIDCREGYVKKEVYERPNWINNTKVFSTITTDENNLFIERKYNMDVYEVYSGLVIRKDDLEIVVENHVFAKTRQDAQNKLLVDLIRELDGDTDVDPTDFEFILNKVGNVSREKLSE